MAAKEEEQLDEQDEGDHHPKEEGPARIELFDHGVVELFGRAQLLGHKILVVGNADLAGGQTVEAGSIHVAEELDDVVGVFGEDLLADLELD